MPVRAVTNLEFIPLWCLLSLVKPHKKNAKSVTSWSFILNWKSGIFRHNSSFWWLLRHKKLCLRSRLIIFGLSEATGHWYENPILHTPLIGIYRITKTKLKCKPLSTEIGYKKWSDNLINMKGLLQQMSPRVPIWILTKKDSIF